MDYTILLERIELLCNKNNITKTLAFEKCGVGKDFASNIKKGSKPSIEKLQQLADYFNVSTDYLLGNDTSKTKDPATDDEIKFALFKGSEGITDEMYEEVKRFAEMVKLRESQKKGKK
ncbi:MAG: helix-turn-helix domain-containing protein [Ruminiclostridium sp.]